MRPKPSREKPASGMRGKIVALYCKLKDLLEGPAAPSDEKEERAILERLDPAVVLQYVDACVDMLGDDRPGGKKP